jgi:hypothetical protein
MNARLEPPTAAQQRVAALELLGRARIQIGSCTYWAEQGDCPAQLAAALQVLAAQVETARQVLLDAEQARQ